jgi:precorrin-6A synthase
MLREFGWPRNIDTIVVLLDEQCSFNLIDNDKLFIWWGAYLGMEKQMLLSGRVNEIGTQIFEARVRAKLRYGWIMDTYILKKQ